VCSNKISYQLSVSCKRWSFGLDHARRRSATWWGRNEPSAGGNRHNYSSTSIIRRNRFALYTQPRDLGGCVVSRDDFRSVRKESVSIEPAKEVGGWRRMWCRVNRQFGTMINRPHRTYAVHRCSQLLQMSHVAWSVCLSMCIELTVRCTKTTQPIEMLFGELTHLDTRSHVLDGVEIPMRTGTFERDIYRPMVSYLPQSNVPEQRTRRTYAFAYARGDKSVGASCQITFYSC